MFCKEICEMLPLPGKVGLAGDPSARDNFSSYKRGRKFYFFTLIAIVQLTHIFFVFCSIMWKTEIKKYSGTPSMRPALGQKTRGRNSEVVA